MQKAQSGFVDGQYSFPMFVNARVFAEPQFLRFEIPITEVMPKEIPQRLSRLVVAVSFERASSYVTGGFETVENPGVRCRGGRVRDSVALRCPIGDSRPFHIHEQPPRSVPD